MTVHCLKVLLRSQRSPNEARRVEGPRKGNKRGGRNKTTLFEEYSQGERWEEMNWRDWTEVMSAVTVLSHGS